MEPISLKLLTDLFSKPRLSPYLRTGLPPQGVLDKYHKNIALSEAMIPTLHYFEICLRNRINQIIQATYGKNWLQNPPSQLMVSDQDSKKIREGVTKILRERRRGALHDDILAQMTFGFWCSFFHKKYDPVLWHLKKSMKILFPNLPRKNRTRGYVEQKILKIKIIRNRIAHHEPVWNHKVSVVDAHAICHQLICAMSQEAGEMLKKIDRFPQVYQDVKHLLES